MFFFDTEKELAMSSANQMLELRPQERTQGAELRRSPRLSRVSILLLMVCSNYGLCMRQAKESGVVTDTNQAKADSATVKRPVTVADSIRMTRLGDRLYDWGGPSKGLVAKFSPDGKRFVVVLRKGNLETNTNDYSLILFETNEAFNSPNPRALLSMSSSSNRPAIQNVVWMDDNDTILFLGERPGETTQLYSLKRSSKELKKLTHHATNLSSFVAAAKGGEIIFIAENPEVSFLNKDSARQGINITSELVSDLIAGKHGGAEYDDHTLFIQQAGGEAETRVTTEGRVGVYSELSLSPDGLHLVVKTQATNVPDIWTEYNDPSFKAARHPASAPGAGTSIFQYELVDIPTASSRLLFYAPIAIMWSEVAWSPDSQSVVVSNMHLPLNIDEAAERARRKTHTFLAEIKISNRQLVKISDKDFLLLYCELKTNDGRCEVGRDDSLNGHLIPTTYFT